MFATVPNRHQAEEHSWMYRLWIVVVPWTPCCRDCIGWIDCLTQYSTIFQLHVYMWRHIDVQATRRSWTYGRVPQRHRHFEGFNVPVQAPTRGQPLYGYSEKPSHFRWLNGAVSRNNRKKDGPCWCLDGQVKKPYENPMYKVCPTSKIGNGSPLKMPIIG